MANRCFAGLGCAPLARPVADLASRFGPSGDIPKLTELHDRAVQTGLGKEQPDLINAAAQRLEGAQRREGSMSSRENSPKDEMCNYGRQDCKDENSTTD